MEHTNIVFFYNRKIALLNFISCVLDIDPCANSPCGLNSICSLDFTTCGYICKPSKRYLMLLIMLIEIFKKYNRFFVLFEVTTVPTTTTVRVCPCFYTGPLCDISKRFNTYLHLINVKFILFVRCFQTLILAK